MKKTCGACGAQVGWYRTKARPAVRMCEHADPKTGKKCRNSRKPLVDAVLVPTAESGCGL